VWIIRLGYLSYKVWLHNVGLNFNTIDHFHAILIVLRLLKICQKAMGKIYIEIVCILEC
jgi:hypothetical protein